MILITINVDWKSQDFNCLLGVVVVGAKRTPFGTYGGKLAKSHITDLQSIASKAALASGNVNPELVDSTVIGNVMPVSI